MKSQRYYRKTKLSLSKVNCSIPYSPLSQTLVNTQMHLNQFSQSKNQIYRKKSLQHHNVQQGFRKSVYEAINQKSNFQKSMLLMGNYVKSQIKRNHSKNPFLNPEQNDIKVYLCESDLIPKKKIYSQESFPRLDAKKFTIKKLDRLKKKYNKQIATLDKLDPKQVHGRNFNIFQPWDNRDDSCEFAQF